MSCPGEKGKKGTSFGDAKQMVVEQGELILLQHSAVISDGAQLGALLLRMMK